jgi:glycosyltransferase involved in cell wall biosynthesis
MLFSVVICTYNRAALLAQALDSALAQAYPVHDYEVIVVDNASTDDTPQVVQQRLSGHPHLRYEREPQQGLSAARNRGWQAALGRYVAYLDDDAIAPPDWLTSAHRLLDALGELDAFGGPYFACYNAPRPAWFKDAYGSWELASQGRFLLPADHLCGGNLFVRRAVFAQVGGFDPHLGMSGGKLAYGEETAFLHRLKEALPDSRLYYTPEVRIQHLVMPRKMTLRHQLRQRFNEGRYAYLTFANGRHTLTLRHVLGLFALPFVMVFEASIGVLLRNRKRYPHWQNYYFEVVMGRIAQLGKLVERLRNVVGRGRR